MNAPLKPTNEAAATFLRRHIGPSPRDVEAMLATVGAKSLTALMDETLPASIRQQAPLDLGTALSETEALSHMNELAAGNATFTSLIGQGYYGTVLPAVIQRNILENPAWYTAYTPYQPEISQGRLEALFNFQTMICDLTGLDIANASLLDEATAAAEAMALAERHSQVKAKAFFVDREVHPQTLAVLRTRAEPLGWHLIVGDPATDLDKADVLGGLLQYPGTSGEVRDPPAPAWDPDERPRAAQDSVDGFGHLLDGNVVVLERVGRVEVHHLPAINSIRSPVSARRVPAGCAG